MKKEDGGSASTDSSRSSKGRAKRVAKRARLFDCARRTRLELRELGRSLRSVAPRQSHGDWQASASRPDPLEVLRGQESGRVEALIPVRYGRMLVSPFTFYRGSAAVMAWDLCDTPTTGINVQACGDAHFYNFGGYASPERRLIYDINDFDETQPGPWEYDVKRLAASVLLDARDHGYDDAVGLESVSRTIRHYCDEIRALSRETTLDIHYAHVESQRLIEEADDSRVVKAVRRYANQARRRTHASALRKLVTKVDRQNRLVENPPLMERLDDTMVEALHQMFNEYRRTLPANRRHVLDQYRFRDAARRVVGVGSVGLRAYVVLLEGRGDPDPLFIQIKEAVPSVLAPVVGKSVYRNNGQRVVAGQKLMQAASDPFLGWARFDGRDVYVRQFRDMKGSTDKAPSIKVFHVGSELAGGTLARAHARSVDPAVLDGYLGSGKGFVKAITRFSLAYAGQAESDHARLQQAVEASELPAAAA